MAFGMRSTPRGRFFAVMAAATALNLPFGTIYAFSVFLKPMEAMLGVGRAEMSFVFGLATITLTLGMNLAPRLYLKLPPGLLVLACGTLSAAGLALTAAATGLAEFAIGYGVLFGFGAGIAFTTVQQGVNQSVTGASGFANGYVVSLFPLGAMIGAPLFGWSIAAWGIRATLAALGITVFATSALAAFLVHAAEIRMHDANSPGAAGDDPQWKLFLRLSTVFFLAAAAGLTVLSQAAGIVQAYGGKTALALVATTFITGAIAAARMGGGWLTDRFPVPRVAVCAHVCSLAGALMLVAWPGPLVSVPALAMIGTGYGIMSGVSVSAIAQYWHKNAYGRVASRLYIAWCLAAISLPVLAGWLFDRTQGYGTAIAIAAGVNVLGIVLATGLPPGTRPSQQRQV
jgi:OFA family oxalate/formate antiporter-like MFS transporter